MTQPLERRIGSRSAGRSVWSRRFEVRGAWYVVRGNDRWLTAGHSFRRRSANCYQVVERAERRVAPKRWFRPPGAASEVAFLAACTRCGDCIDVCPVHAILKMPANGGGLAAGTPYIDPTTRACIACEDMPCANACETGALTAIPWSQVHMGILELV